MIKIGIVYFSNTDVTGKLARAACSELVNQKVLFFSHQILGAEIIEGRFINKILMDELKTCDAIIFGSPTYMGNVAAQFKAFADATSDFWETQDWSGKIAAGFTSGTGLNGDQASTLQYFVTLASQHGMIWVGLDAPFSNTAKGVNRLGCQLGVTSHSLDGSAHETDIRSSKYLAHRVLTTVQKFKSGTYPIVSDL
ncbi:flavodoxin family protein [Microbulbifer sp. 2304DJ12-6]|uniref:flavodoxin family protein n=1 Tax=Microbulbifer sp. 2304DJ12-6 TaxID=3233340 RepID=UPI0039AF7FB0